MALAEAPRLGFLSSVPGTADVPLTHYLISSENPPIIRRYPGGLDLEKAAKKLDEKNNGNTYEEFCFANIVMNLTDNEFAIGPHLIDKSLGRLPVVQFARPDAMVFALRDESLLLKEMHEYKNHKKNGLVKLREKIAGFPSLLNYLRSNPGFFESLINTASENMIDIGRIIIPPDSEISVLVIRQHPVPDIDPLLPYNTQFQQLIMPFLL
jgi:hypothetical protein